MPTAIDLGQPINQSSPLNRGLVAWCMALPYSPYWGGSRILDLCGKNHGTLVNSPRWTGRIQPGGFGGLNFVRASTQTAGFTLSANSITSNNAFTISLWVTNDVAPDTSANTDRWAWSSSDSANSCRISHHDRSGFSPTTSFAVRSGFSGPAVSFSSPTLNVSTPYHIVGVYKSGDQRLYLNGVLKASGTTSFTLPQTFGDMVLGSGWDGSVDSVRLYDMALSDAACRELFVEEYTGFRSVLNWYRPRVYFDMGGGGGHTTTAALTISSQTLSASAEHDTPVYTGDSALTINNQTLDADATHTPPTSEGTGNLNVSNQTLDGSGTHTTPVYEGVGDLNVTNQELASSASHTAPVYEGTADLGITNQTLVASGTFATQLFSGTSDLTVSNQQLAASGTFDEGTFTGDATLVVSNPLLAAFAEFDAPVYEGTSALSISNQTLDAEALFAAEIYLGEAALQIGQQVLSGSATYTFPTYSGEGALQSSQQTLAADAQVTNPAYTGEGALLLSSPTLAADALYADDLFTGLGTFNISNMVLSAEAVFTGITLEFRERLIINVDGGRTVINSTAPTRLVVDLER